MNPLALLAMIPAALLLVLVSCFLVRGAIRLLRKGFPGLLEMLSWLIATWMIGTLLVFSGFMYFWGVSNL